MAEREAVRLIFLGGIGEVGRNLFLLETGEDIIVVDCGIGFPAEDQLGVDLVLPDISYLTAQRDKLRAIFITHGHEDHIGALPYLLPELRVPVYATRLTAGLIDVKLREAGLSDVAPVHVFNPDEHPTLKAGAFTVVPFRVCHSIPDAVGFGISTPAGLIVHTSDFKLDPTPVDGKMTDYATLRAFGDQGVRLLISDCVHVETPGRTLSERVVGETYEQVFATAPGRIIIATFASLIARIQQVIDTAHRYDRKVAALGRSLENNIRVARELGYLHDPDNVLVTPRTAAQLPANEVVYVVTGSQGEPMAVLSRIANRDHRQVEIREGDTVIVSATPIPGNETSVFRIIDRLFAAGADVIYPARALVHVSGHASRDELAEVIALTRPRHIVPTHGEARHLALYRELAGEQGLPASSLTLANIGDVIEITPEDVHIAGQLDVGYVYVEGATVGEVSDIVIRDRQTLSRDGLIMIVVQIDRQTGTLVGAPEILARGVARNRHNGDLFAGVRQEVSQIVAEQSRSGPSEDPNYLSRQIRESIASYLFGKSRRRPLVLPVVLDV